MPTFHPFSCNRSESCGETKVCSTLTKNGFTAIAFSFLRLTSAETKGPAVGSQTPPPTCRSSPCATAVHGSSFRPAVHTPSSQSDSAGWLGTALHVGGQRAHCCRKSLPTGMHVPHPQVETENNKESVKPDKRLWIFLTQHTVWVLLLLLLFWNTHSGPNGNVPFQVKKC